jgi:hypothetical protein
MNHLNIKLPIFEDRCHVFWPYTKSEAELWLKKRKYDVEVPAENSCQGFTCFSSKRGNGAAIFIKKWKGSIKDIGVLVHEIVHAASFIRSGLGVEETNDTAEVLCYVTDFITQRALSRMGINPTHQPTKPTQPKKTT